MKDKNIVDRVLGKGVFPHQFAFTLLIPLRNIFLSPKKLIKRLALSPDATVLEIGPGPGYFSVHVARALAKGKLVLADIQPQMLKHAKKRLEKRKLTNVEYHLCDGKTLPFSDNTFDRIFMVTVIGEIDNKDAYMRELYRVLKKDGILSFSEQAGDPDMMSTDEIILLAQKHNFVLYEKFGTKRNYTLNVIVKKI